VNWRIEERLSSLHLLERTLILTGPVQLYRFLRQLARSRDISRSRGAESYGWSLPERTKQRNRDPSK
jgi:hypothetical protein